MGLLNFFQTTIRNNIIPVINKVLRITTLKARTTDNTGRLDLNEAFTLTLVVRRSQSTPIRGYLFIGYNGSDEKYAVVEGYGNNMEFMQNNFTSGRATFGAINDDLYHELKLVNDGTTIKSYTDGVLKETIVASIFPTSGTTNLTIGGTRAADGIDTWMGDFDSFKIEKASGNLEWNFNDTVTSTDGNLTFTIVGGPEYVIK